MVSLSTKVRKLFESHTNGIINYQNYEMVMHDLQKEQKNFELKQVNIQSKMSDLNSSKSQLAQFQKAVKSYSDIEALTYVSLNN